jgi:WD40 repeat protein
MSARAVGACGAGVTVVLASVSGALINELHGGWPWWVTAGAVVLISAALSAWLALRPPDSSRTGSAGDHVGPAAVKVGRDIWGSVTTNSSLGHDATQPPTTAPATAEGWAQGPEAGGVWVGPGAVFAGGNIIGPVAVINGPSDRPSDAIFDPQSLAATLDLSHFTGRKWLIERIDTFIADHQCGYVVVQAGAGVGKSALAAHLVWTRKYPYHFTRLEGGRSPEQARRSLAAQLIDTWKLHDLVPGDTFPASAGRPDWLVKVLREAAKRRDATCPGQPLVLIVDGLDEAAPPIPDHDTGIPLGLPRPENLPSKVFIVATSRFGTPLPALDGPVTPLTITVEGPDNLADLRQFLTNAVTGASPQGALADILAEHDVDTQWFVESLLDRYGGVWMYLRYILDDILHKRRSPADVRRLPDQLTGYYLEQIHRWRRDPTENWESLGLPVVATLAALRRHATRTEIASLAGVADGAPLRHWLVEEGLRPFLTVTPDRDNRHRYEIQDHSLRELFAPPTRFDERDDTGATLHQALRAAHQRITAALIPPGSPGERDWGAADDYIRSSLAEHAASSGQLDELACDPGFLLVCDEASLLRHRASVTTADGRAAIAAYELALNDWTGCDSDELRAWWLHVWAHKTRSRPLADRTATYHSSDWQVVTAMWTGSSHRALPGHQEPVSALCALPRPTKTSLLVSAGRDRMVRFWDPAADKQVRQLIGYSELVNTLCPVVLDGRRVLASGGVDCTVRLWDLASGELAYKPLLGHTDEVSALCALPRPRNTLLASAGRDRVVRLWDPAAGTQVGQLIGYPELVNALCPLVLPDERRMLVSGGVDGTVRLWDPDSGKQIGRPWAGHTDEVSAVCSVKLPDSGRSVLASASLDGTVRLWDPVNGQQIDQELTGHTYGVSSVCAVPLIDGRDLLASGGHDRTLRLWHPDSGQPAGRPLEGHVGQVTAACALTTDDGRGLLASGGHDRVLRLWDPISAQHASEPLNGHTDVVSAVCAVPLPDGRCLLASAGHDRVLRLWDPDSGQQTVEPLTGHTDGVSAVCAVTLPDEGRTMLASGGADGTVRLWDPDSGKQIGDPLKGHTDPVTAVCTVTRPDNGRSILASASLDGTVRLWDPGSGKQVGHPLEGHQAWVHAVCPVDWPDGRTLVASAGQDHVLRLWDPVEGQPVGRPLEGHIDAVTAVCAVPLPDGSTALASAGQRVLRWWDPVSGKPMGHPLPARMQRVSTLCAVPLSEGRTALAAGGGDGTVRLWDPVSGQPVGHPLAGHHDQVTAVCLLPQRDGRTRIATASKDRAVLVWALRSADREVRAEQI